jgi:ABC-2 type transport system permease protein
VRIDGSVPASSASPIAFALLTSSFGLLIAAIGKTPEATRGLAIFATLIMVMLGGAWVPSFVFPQWLQTASLVVPTRWAVDGLDAMTWRGLGVDAAVGRWRSCSASPRCSRRSRSGRFDWEEPR